MRNNQILLGTEQRRTLISNGIQDQNIEIPKKKNDFSAYLKNST